MSPLAVRVGVGVLALLAIIALRGKRWAYLAFILLGLAYFPAQAQFHVHMPKCEQLLPTVQQLVPLLHNYLYIALFAGFYWMSWVQLRDANGRAVWALVVTLLAAALFEVAQGMSVALAAKTVAGAKAVAGARAAARAVPTPCHVRDLVPDVAGAVAAMLLLAIWARLTRKPAYVKLVAKRAAVAPSVAKTAAAPRPVAPPRAAPPVYPSPSPFAPPPPPVDFSPGPARDPELEEAAPTEEVAPRKPFAARIGVMQRLQPLLSRLQPILGRIQPFFQRFWSIIRRRRRAIVVGLVLVVVAGAGAFAFLSLSAPPPVVTEQPVEAPLEPPPPPPRQLQSEVVGYYEPSYKFTVFDRRFVRLTLRPSPSVMFARTGTKQEFACEDSRIGQDQVRLRCTVAPYGVVIVEGRFPTRYATSKLDMPVLSAFVTVTNNRGEVQYRARDSFYWHVPDEQPGGP